MKSIIAIVLIVIGALAVVAGILYLSQPADSLPSFMPGHLAHATAKHTTRGTAALIFGAVLVVAGLAVWLISPGGRRVSTR